MKKGGTPWNKGKKLGKSSQSLSDKLTEEALTQMYILDGMTANDIAAKMNCSSTTVLNYLKLYGIQKRSLSETVSLVANRRTADQLLARAKKCHATWKSKPKHEIDAIVEKRQSSPNFNSAEALEKSRQTRLKNGTSKESKAENAFFKRLLMEGIDETDIVRHYKSLQYPFDCDFYIRSKDLYIEFQGHWSHGPKPYSMSSDQEKLTCTHSTFVDRDPYKLDVAKSNNIRLLLVYPSATYLLDSNKMITVDLNDINKM